MDTSSIYFHPFDTMQMRGLNLNVKVIPLNVECQGSTNAFSKVQREQNGYILTCNGQFVSISATFKSNNWLYQTQKSKWVRFWSLIWVENDQNSYQCFPKYVLKITYRNTSVISDRFRLVLTSSNWLAIRLVKIGGQTIWIRICFFLFQRGFVVKTLL